MKVSITEAAAFYMLGALIQKHKPQLHADVCKIVHEALKELQNALDKNFKEIEASAQSIISRKVDSIFALEKRLTSQVLQALKRIPGYGAIEGVVLAAKGNKNITIVVLGCLYVAAVVRQKRKSLT